MRISKAVWLPGLFAVLALVLVACGGSDPTVTPSAPQPAIAGPTAVAVVQQESSELSAEEIEYLEDVTAAAQLTNDWPQPAAMFYCLILWSN